VRNCTRRKRQRGSAFVEASLCLLSTIVILVGIIDIGQLLFIQSTLAERVRSATSFGVRVYEPDAIRNIVLYGTATPQPDQRPFFNLTPDMVSVERRDAGTTADRVVVGVSGYPLVFLTPGMSRVAQAVPIRMAASYDGV
jgi:hypothetical protein